VPVGWLLLLFTALYPDGKYVFRISPPLSFTFSFTETGLNLYDVRKRCSVPEYGPECFPEIGWLESWMNGEDVKRSLGVDPTLTFEACNADVSKDFALQADAMRNSALLLTDLVNEGVRLLVYAGNTGQPPHTETPL
jgi:carboxypeptidase C (cathepsin A)